MSVPSVLANHYASAEMRGIWALKAKIVAQRVAAYRPGTVI